MSGTESVTPADQDHLAQRMGSTLGPIFDSCGEKLEAAELGGSAFSLLGAALTAVYPTAQAFAQRDLQTKSQNVASIIQRLGSTARTWSDAEHHSTVKAN